MESSRRRDILDATKDLLWSVGYESMSPRNIMAASGAGQGSLYHHFSGKSELAAEALTEVAAEMRADLERVFDPRVAPLARLQRYLRADRQGLRGCRLGRLANESAFTDGELRGPLEGYFREALRLVETALKEAIKDAALPKRLDAHGLAAAIVASVQGGYVLSRALNDPSMVNEAAAGALALLERIAHDG
jgi:AcrR family transcriptional regulator